MPDSTGGILTIRQLADYLMVSEKTVYRMLERRELPGVRVGAQWRFRREDIDAWLKDEMRRADARRGVLSALEPSELAIAPLLAPENVWLSVAVKSRDELLSFLVTSASIDEHVDRQQLLQSMRERESICSTALVQHAAFPHPTDPQPFRFTKKRVLLATLSEPVDFEDPHGHRPRIIAAILARSMQGHLLALSRAIKLFGDLALIESLAAASSPGDAIRIIAAAEARFA